MLRRKPRQGQITEDGEGEIRYMACEAHLFGMT